MKPTKKRILLAAKDCFATKGVAATRLQDIAELAGMSIGNMVYHFRNQVEMLEVIYTSFQQRQEELLQDICLSPVFSNIDEYLQNAFQLHQEFLFFPLHTLEVLSASPRISSEWREHLRWKDLQLELMLRFNQARGALSWDEETYPVGDLAVLWRRTIDGWPMHRVVEQKNLDDFSAFRKSAWSVLLSLITPEARPEYLRLHFTSAPQVQNTVIDEE
jgi:AcrR family transcriptional regulator